MMLIIALISIAVAFAATIVSGIIKIIFFAKKKDTYRHILKFGLIGTLVGFLIVPAIWIFNNDYIAQSPEPENMIAIPFYTMLAGQLAGIFIISKGKKA